MSGSDDLSHRMKEAGRIARGQPREQPSGRQSRSIENPSPAGSGGAGKARYRGKDAGIRRRLQVAQGRKQALLKITSFGKGIGHINGHLGYITRHGTLSLEAENGERIEGKAAARALMQEWAAEGFGSRKNARDTANMILGVPPGANREVLGDAVRAFAEEAFEGHRYLWVQHDDTQSPHVHLVLHLTHENGRKPHLSVRQLEEWRGKFAAHCRQYGIEVDASRAWERGRAPRKRRLTEVERQGRRIHRMAGRQRPDPRQVAWHMKGRGGALRKDDISVRRVYAEVQGGQRGEKPWERKREDNVGLLQAIYREDAAELRNAAMVAEGAEAKRLFEAAERMAGFAERLTVQNTRAQEVEALIRSRQQEIAGERAAPRQRDGNSLS